MVHFISSWGILRGGGRTLGVFLVPPGVFKISPVKEFPLKTRKAEKGGERGPCIAQPGKIEAAWKVGEGLEGAGHWRGWDSWGSSLGGQSSRGTTKKDFSGASLSSFRDHPGLCFLAMDCQK